MCSPAHPASAMSWLIPESLTNFLYGACVFLTQAFYIKGINLNHIKGGCYVKLNSLGACS